jgi:hypothetical protein
MSLKRTVIVGTHEFPCDEAIKIPTNLTDVDGRRFAIRSWRPVVVAGDCVSVTIEAVIEMPQDIVDQHQRNKRKDKS